MLLYIHIHRQKNQIIGQKNGEQTRMGWLSNMYFPPNTFSNMTIKENLLSVRPNFFIKKLLLINLGSLSTVVLLHYIWSVHLYINTIGRILFWELVFPNIAIIWASCVTIPYSPQSASWLHESKTLRHTIKIPSDRRRMHAIPFGPASAPIHLCKDYTYAEALVATPRGENIAYSQVKA